MNELTVRTTDLMPTVAERAHDLAHVPPTWGLYPSVIPRVPIDREPPTMDVLQAMEDELAAGLLPARSIGPGRALCGKLALVLGQSYPQKDDVPQPYTAGLIDRLLNCPADLLQPVLDELLDTCRFRPSLAEVREVIEREVNKRQRLLLRVQAAKRYWDWQQQLRQERAEACGQQLQHKVSRDQRMPTLPGKRKAEREPAPQPAPRPSYIATAKFLAEMAAKPPEKGPKS